MLTGTFNFQRRKWCAHCQVGSVQSEEKTQIPFCVYQRRWQSAEIWRWNHLLVRLHKRNSNCKLELSSNKKSDSKAMFDCSKHLPISNIFTSMYWPTQKACIDSRVSSNCKAASKATTGSSPANWANERMK